MTSQNVTADILNECFDSAKLCCRYLWNLQKVWGRAFRAHYGSAVITAYDSHFQSSQRLKDYSISTTSLWWTKLSFSTNSFLMSSSYFTALSYSRRHDLCCSNAFLDQHPMGSLAWVASCTPIQANHNDVWGLSVILAGQSFLKKWDCIKIYDKLTLLLILSVTSVIELHDILFQRRVSSDFE